MLSIISLGNLRFLASKREIGFIKKRQIIISLLSIQTTPAQARAPIAKQLVGQWHRAYPIKESVRYRCQGYNEQR